MVFNKYTHELVIYILSGCVPLDPHLTKSVEEGSSFVDLYPQSAARDAMQTIIQGLLTRWEHNSIQFLGVAELELSLANKGVLGSKQWLNMSWKCAVKLRSCIYYQMLGTISTQSNTQ